jgi:tetratricopeptide (TPR) repeat protein
VGLFVVLLVGASITWHIRQNTSEKLLARAQLAIKANNFDKAARLADDYIARHPQDWQGYLLRARICLKQGKFEEARAPLTEACRLKPADPALAIALADTHSNAAMQALSSSGNVDISRRIDALRAAAAGLNKANEVLLAFKPADPNGTLDIRQHVAMNEYRVGMSHQTISNLLAEDAKLSDASHNSEQAAMKRARSLYEQNQARKSFGQAIDSLLDVVGKDPSRDVPAEALVGYCLASRDPNSLGNPDAGALALASKAAAALDVARKAILDLKNPPPKASILLAKDDLGSCRSGDTDKIAQIAKRLDVIIAANPDNIQAKLARAEVAAKVSDVATMERLVGEILKAQPQDPEARLLHARVLLAKSDRSQDAKTTAEILAPAEKDLYDLKSQLSPDNPLYARVYYLYAFVAYRTGKKELATEALRTVAQFRQSQYYVSKAQKLFARQLLNQGFAAQAFTYAEPYYQQHPDDPDALLLFVKTAWGTGQRALAGDTLTKAWKGDPDNKSWRGYASGPVLLMAVVEGFDSVNMPKEAGAALDDLIERAKTNPPKTSEEALAVARGFLLKQRPAEAEELLNAMREKAPDDPRLCLALAKLYRDTNRQMQAEELCRQAAALTGLEPSYKLELADMLVDIGDLDEALEVLKPLVLKEDTSAMLMQLRIHGLLGRQIDAEVRAFLQRPDVGRQYDAQLARIYLTAGNPEMCAKTCQAGLKDKPNDAALLTILASAYHALRDDARGIETWKTVIKVNPQSLSAYQKIADLLFVRFAGGDSTSQPAKTIRMSLQQADQALAKARSEMAGIPGARQDLVDLAIAGLYEKAGILERAAESFAKVAANRDTEQYLKYEAQLRQASALARAGKSKEALDLLDSLIGANKGQARAAAMLTKAGALASANRNADAAEVLAELCQQARQEKAPSTLRQAAILQAKIGQVDQALATCQEVQKLCPGDPRGYVIQADILRGAERLDQVPALYEKAIALQPGNLSLYPLLANTLDALGQPVAALKALEETERLGQAGKSLGLLQQGALLAKWGLQAQAIRRFEKLSALVTEPRDDLQLALAASFRRLGQADQAKAALAKISEHSDEYAQGQLMLADLAEGAEAKLRIVRDLATKRPGSESAITCEMALLLRENRPAEALKALEDFQASGKPRRPMPSDAIALAVAAAVRTGSKDGIAQISRELADTATSPQSRLTAVLLTMDDPNAGAKPPPEPSQASVYPTMLNLCLAGMAQDANAARQCADQLTKIDASLGKRQPPLSIPAAHMFLCGLLAQDEPMTNSAAAKLSTGLAAPAARELLSAWSGADKPRVETVKLLKAAIARELPLPELSRTWAMEALKARPTCQWAAMELALAGPDPAQLEWAMDTLRPGDCYLARKIRADLLLQKRQYKQAAEIYAALAQDGGKADPACMESQAMALEGDGQLPEALEIYRRVWQSTASAVSANNAACIVIQLAPKDQARLAEAKQWMDAALKAMPQPALADTAGWIAHLQGRDSDALVLLRRAIKGLPDSPEAHYHLGAVEKASGDSTLGQWHLEAAVDLGNDLKAAGTPIPKMTAEAVELAKQALSAVTKQ